MFLIFDLSTVLFGTSLIFTKQRTMLWSYWLNKSNQIFECLLQLISITASKSFICQTTSIRFKLRPATLKSRMSVISKLLTISSNCTVWCFQLCDVFWIVGKRNIVYGFSFEMKWTVMSILLRICLLDKMSMVDKSWLDSLSFFLPVSVDDLCWHATYQCCGKEENIVMFERKLMASPQT